MISRALDSIIGVISPRWAVERMAARATMQQILGATGTGSGYNAAKINRFTRNQPRSVLPEHMVPRSHPEAIAAQSWELYRNNGSARKVVRSIESKVIGRGMFPHSLATRVDGTPHIEFRQAVKRLWWSMASCVDVRGKPGQGGLDLVEFQKLALRQVILSGEVLCRKIPLRPKEQRRAGSPVAVAYQLIPAHRLSTDRHADGMSPDAIYYRGIELNQSGKRIAYHILPPQMDEFSVPNQIPERIGSDQITHVFIAEDIDQMRGVGWFAPVLIDLRDTDNLNFSILQAASMAACVVMSYRLGSGQRRFGLQSPSSSPDMEDEDGNRINKVQPGMLVNLGDGGEVNLHTPPQANDKMDSLIQSFQRKYATGMPGIKGSTVTGDYRGSSFSSERSADNDIWPEIESIQDWFAVNFCQPMFEEIVTQAMIDGYFSGVMTAEEFTDRKQELMQTSWKGPVPRSINPTDDARAARQRVANGQSSPQLECSAIGVDPVDVMNDVSEWLQQAEANGWPEWMIKQSLGVDNVATSTPQPAQAVDTANQDTGGVTNGDQASQTA